jgi:Radical SAM superfamily
MTRAQTQPRNLAGEVILGNQASEAQAQGLFGFATHTDEPSSSFGAEDIRRWSETFCRNFACKAGVAFRLDNVYRRNWIELVVLGQPTRVGDLDQGQEMPPIKVFIHDRKRWHEVGAFSLTGALRWETHTFELPPDRIQLGDTIKVILDADESFHSPEQHYGVSWHSVRVVGSEPRPEWISTEQDPEVLLMMAPPWNVDMPLVNLASLAAYLRHHGVKTEVLDLNVKLYNSAPPSWRKYWGTNDVYDWFDESLGGGRAAQLLEQSSRYLDWIERLAPRFIGFSFNKINLFSTLATARELHQRLPETKLVVGGLGLYDSNLDQIQQVFDYLVLGEGEESLLEIVRGEPDNPAIIDTSKRTITRDTALQHMRAVHKLSELPPFSLEPFDLSNYRTFQLPGVSSRGCINRCVYCLDRKTCVSYRHFGADYVVKQLRELRQKHSANFVYFVDLLVNGHLKRLEEMCDALIEADLRLEWASFAMVRPSMSDELLSKMRQAGCVGLIFGVESASPKVLEAMRKSYGPAEIVEMLEKTKRAGIRTTLNLIFGFPGESWDDFIETVDFIVEHKGLIDQIGSITDTLLLPNTDLYFEQEAYGIEKLADDVHAWRDADNDHHQRMKKCQHALDRFAEEGISMVQPTGSR